MTVSTQQHCLPSTGVSSFVKVFTLFFGLSFFFISTHAAVIPTASCPSTSSYAIPQPANPTVRRDWQSLTASEKQRFADAFVALSTGKITPSLASFNCFYNTALRSLGGGFPPLDYILFLKVLLKHVEDTFRIGGFSEVTIPYGNWEPAFPSPVAYETSTLGARSAGTNNCVDFSGTPFAAYDICVNRPYWNPIYSVDENRYNQLLDIPSLIPFAFDAVIGIQLTINFDYAGLLLNAQTPLWDPIFFLHSANLLRLFDKWQELHPTPPSEIPNANVSYYNSQTQRTTYNRGFDGVTYGQPVFDPLNQISSGANDVFGGMFNGGGQGEGFWGSRGKRSTLKNKRSSTKHKRAECNTVSYASQMADPPRNASDYFISLLDNSSPNFRKFLANAVNISAQIPDLALAAIAADRLNWGLSFNYAIHWANVFEQYQSGCQGLYYFGAKFPSWRGYITTRIITAALKDLNFRSFLNRAASIYKRAYQYKSTNSTLRRNLPTSPQLTSLGSDLVKNILAIVSPGKTLSTIEPSPPTGWTCPDQWYGQSDGCDCNCGIVDPDCDAQPRSVFTQTFATPVFGCFDGPFAQCFGGQCSYVTPNNASIPSNWTCAFSSYNSGDGCDCECGARDPDCDKVYPWNYRTFAPLLYEVKGCTAGRGATCSSSGKCQYVLQVPSAWRCPIDKYGDGSVCDCNCGAQDPDCDDDDVVVEGCGCDGLTCKNKYGICEGSCSSRTASVKVYAYGTDPCSGPTPAAPTCPPPSPLTPTPTPTPAPTPTPTPTPAPSVPSKTKVEVNINFQNMLNGLQP